MHPERAMSKAAPKNAEGLIPEFFLYAAASPLAPLISGASPVDPDQCLQAPAPPGNPK
jgi:hypothetical protein